MSEIRIADLFAGIGGIRMGMVQALGDAAHVVYSSEWNKYSVQTYEANWHDENPVAGDITKVDEHDVPDIDLLLAGFPCQPFSIAGVSKKHDVKPIAHGNVGSILLPASQVPDKYVLSDKLWTYLQNYKKKHEAAGNGFGYGMVDAATDHTRTLSARYGKDGSEILVSRGEGKTPRRLTPRECARLMGYPDSFSIPVSDTQAYRQFGNSVAVPVIRAIGEAMKPYLSD